MVLHAVDEHVSELIAKLDEKRKDEYIAFREEVGWERVNKRTLEKESKDKSDTDEEKPKTTLRYRFQRAEDEWLESED